MTEHGLKGFVPTPDAVVDRMVAKLFAKSLPTSASRVLDPGCGTGPFIHGVIRFCRARGLELPRIDGIELDPGRALAAARAFKDFKSVRVRNADFLGDCGGEYDFIVGNPPYVSITGLAATERLAFRGRFESARGRFDLYVLFFEQALRLLALKGRLVFITPEKFVYVGSAMELRRLLLRRSLTELEFASETTFDGLTTYPLITTIDGVPTAGRTRVVPRLGRTRIVALRSSESWLPVLSGGAPTDTTAPTLASVSVRISCGVATGSDSVFVLPEGEVTLELSRFARRTVSGRQILPSGQMKPTSRMLVPYDVRGNLLSEVSLGALGEYLERPELKRRLLARTCVLGKPWYAFHDNFPAAEMLRPKILCKDITQRPVFVIDRCGDIVPRHSVYYIVPQHAELLVDLHAYLSSPEAEQWLRANCQRAANGYMRLQSTVMRRLPIPRELARRCEELSGVRSTARAELAG